ncbi:MAG: hypothetical protein U0Q22_16730 [Acidimicrobiales bacterium]
MNDLVPDPADETPDDEVVEEADLLDDDPDEESDDETEETGDEAEDDGPTGKSALFDGEHVDYEFADWSGQSIDLLDSMLASEGIAHVWQGAELAVRAEDEAATDALIEVVSQTATRGLDKDRTRVVYEVGTWSAAMQTSLAEALDIAEVPFEWDEQGDLVVYEDDEERVEEVLDAMPDPDDPDAVDADGLDVQDILSHLWEATGTLAKKPADPDAVLAAVDSADRLEHLALPFGFDSAVWRDIVGKAVALRGALDGDDEEDEMSDDDLKEGCRQLHEQLRPLV